MQPDNHAGWCYVLTHPAWDKIGMLKIGMTKRDPQKRASEIASVSGLIAPCRIAYCAWVADRSAVERSVHNRLSHLRVRRGRELFRVDVAAAVAAIEGATRVRRTHVRQRARYRRHPWWRAFLRLFGG